MHLYSTRIFFMALLYGMAEAYAPASPLQVDLKHNASPARLAEASAPVFLLIV